MRSAATSDDQATAATSDHRGSLHGQLTRGMMRLGVWHVRRLVERGEVTPARIADALTRRVNIYRLTKLWDGTVDPALGHRDPRWDELVAGLTRIVAEAAEPEVEARALALLEPFAANAPRPLPRARFGCFYYHPVGAGVTDRDGLGGCFTNPRKLWEKTRRALGLRPAPRHAELHFVNATRPASPFADQPALARSLAALVADCRQRHPTVRWLWCESWLNSRPEFGALFPTDWHRNGVELSPAAVDKTRGRSRLNTDNWWGQFVRRDGGFHERNAARFRAGDGAFPYGNRRCRADLDAIADHLRRAFDVTAPPAIEGPC